jgi:hypothetical protein
MQIHCEGSDVSEAVPNGAANREVHWLYLDSEPQAVEPMKLMKVSVHDAQRP